MSRGMLTEEVNKIAEDIIHRKITQVELRLMPYIQYVMLNEQIIEPIKLNSDERNILQKWRDEGFIEGGASGLSITKDFYDFICEILFEAYVKNRT